MQPPLVTPDVADPTFWPDFNGQPQLFGTSSQRISASEGSRAYLVDGFSNGMESLSDGGLAVVSSRPDLYEETNLSQFDNFHIARAAEVRWVGGDSLTWTLDTEARTALAGATSLTFRAGVAVDVVDPNGCIGVDGEAPELALRVSDLENDVVIDLAQYGRLSLPEARDETVCNGEQSDGCHAWDVMQTTYRVPLADICSQNPQLFLSEIRDLSLEFSGIRGVLIFDDVQLNSIPGEPAVSCRCSP